MGYLSLKLLRRCVVKSISTHRVTAPFLILLTISLLTGFEAPMASAQVLYGSIVGTVTDQANAVVPKATVTVRNTAIGLTRTVDTDDAGYYSIPSLPEGSYDLSVTAPGF